MPRRESKYGATIVQALLERGGEQRRRLQKEEDVKRAIKLQKIVYGTGSLESKQEAAVRLQAMGFAVDQSALQPKNDLTAAFDYVDFPKSLRGVFQREADLRMVDASQVLRVGAALGAAPKEMTLDMANELVKQEVFKGTEMEKYTGEQVFARFQTIKTIEANIGDIGVETQNRILGIRDTEKPTSKEESIAILDKAVRDKEGKVRPFEEVLNDPKVMVPIVGARMMDDLYGFYGLIPPSAFKGVSATSIFNQAMDTVQERLKNEEKKLALLEDSLSDNLKRPAESEAGKRRPKLETQVKEQRLIVGGLRSGLVDSVSALTGRLQMSGIGGGVSGVNPAGTLPALDSPISDRTAEYITQLQQLISSGAIPASSITDEDWQEAAANGIDIERVKRELGLE